MTLSDASCRRNSRVAVFAGLALSLTAFGCAHPRPPVRLDSPDINARIIAIKRAARARDVSAAPQLVIALDDDDPAVRFYAIKGLERLAGDRKGYDYHEDDADARRPAVARWRAWVEAQGMTMPDAEAQPSAP
jgi:HEAT repeat protein